MSQQRLRFPAQAFILAHNSNRGRHTVLRCKEETIAIDTELILRLARDLQRLELTRTRAQELAAETAGLVENAFAAAESLGFEDEPGQFVAVLAELRER
jgi:hypothetical protein